MDGLLSILDAIVGFVGDETRQGALALIGAGVGAVAVAGWALYKQFSKTDTKEAAPPSSGEIRLTIEEYDRRLKLRAEEISQAILAAEGEDKRRLESERNELESRLRNINGAFEEANTKIVALEEALASVSSDVSQARISAAGEALEKGELELAENIFEEVLERAAATLNVASRAAYGLGIAAEEKVQWERAAEYFSKAYGFAPSEPALHKASLYLWRSGRYESAVSATAELLELVSSRCGEVHPTTAAIMNNLAAQLYDWGNQEEALRYLKKSLEIRGRLGERKTEGYAASLSNLGNMHLVRGEFDLAIKFHSEARDIMIELNATDGEFYATASNSLGEAYRLTGDYDAAEGMMKEALRVDGSNYGLDHPFVARDHNFLGKLMISKGDLPDAERHLKRSFDIAARSLGHYHPNCVAIAGNLYRVTAKLRQTKSRTALRSELEKTYPGLATAPDEDATH